MTNLNFGHIKRICESDAGHGMTKTALIHWVLGSIAEVERLENVEKNGVWEIVHLEKQVAALRIAATKEQT